MIEATTSNIGYPSLVADSQSGVLEDPENVEPGHRPESRKSTTSIRRKPVPATTTVPIDSELASITPFNHDLEPPTYILQSDLPTNQERPPTYPQPNLRPAYHLSDTHTLAPAESLPRYAEETQTEPKTLARGLWRFGWLCPLLWAIGMCM